MIIHCSNCGIQFEYGFCSGVGGFGKEFRCCTRVCHIRFELRRTCDIMGKTSTKEGEDKYVEADRQSLIKQGFSNDQLERMGHKPA